MKIGIFGGSFNPIHKGHEAIANYALNHLNLDKIIFVPTYINPSKTNLKGIDPLTNAKHRLAMLKIVLKDYPEFEISDFEIKRKNISYTIDTIKYFKEKYSNDDLYFLLGSDNLKTINKWQSIKTIAQLVKLAIFKRSNQFMHLNFKKYNCILINNPLFNYSSTNYKQGNLQAVTPEVQTYIGANKLYLLDFLKNFSTPNRFKHGIATANLAREYATLLKLDKTQSYYAGLLHDLTKNWSDQQHKVFLKKFHSSTEHFPPHELHGLTASIWLEKYYLINDPALCHAIKIHTVLSLDLSSLDKIVYAADKLCQGRKWPGIQIMRKKILENFDEGFQHLVSDVYKIILEKHKTLSQEQMKIYEKWANSSVFSENK